MDDRAAEFVVSDADVPSKFYHSLPKPWNVAPMDLRNAQSQQKREVADFFKIRQNTKLPVFSGDEASYFDWRDAFLFLVHVQQVGIPYKCLALKNVLDENVPEIN